MSCAYVRLSAVGQLGDGGLAGLDDRRVKSAAGLVGRGDADAGESCPCEQVVVSGGGERAGGAAGALFGLCALPGVEALADVNRRRGTRIAPLPLNSWHRSAAPDPAA